MGAAHEVGTTGKEKGRTAKPGYFIVNPVAQTSKSAVSQVSKPANAPHFDALPIWKSAIRQVWKPALRRFSRTAEAIMKYRG
jgi:hypothetical protein